MEQIRLNPNGSHYSDLPAVSRLKKQSSMTIIFFEDSGHFVCFGADAVEAAFCLSMPLWFRRGRVQIKSECLSIRTEQIQESVARLTATGNPVALLNKDATEKVYWPIKLPIPPEFETVAEVVASEVMEAVVLETAGYAVFNAGMWENQAGEGWVIDHETEVEVPF